jgi:Zn-dependent peptidase ImmA (M78 family)/DNA-binding XRE family transcriptional regulator
MEALNPGMVILAREIRGLTQAEVAQRVGCTQGTLSKVENGQLDPSTELVADLCRFLCFPRQFFFYPLRYKHLPMTFFRKRLRVSSALVKTITARINLVRLHTELLSRSAKLPAVRIPALDIKEFDNDARRVAKELRLALHLPVGPIANLTRTLEDCGILILTCDFGSNQIDGLSIFEPDDALPPIILVNPNVPGDRLRYTLAHELMHIVLHHHLAVPGAEVEQQANEGASEFLMPASDIRGFLGDLNLKKLSSLKPYWKVSMQALIMRAADLGKITERQKRSLFVRMSQYGWRTQEPIEIPREEPTLVSELIEFHLGELGYSEEELAKAILCDLAEFREMYRGVPKQPGLRVVRGGQVLTFAGNHN